MNQERNDKDGGEILGEFNSSLNTMCDSLVMQFPSTFPDSLAKCSQIPGRDCNSEIQLELFDEFLSDNFSMLEVRNCAGEAKSFGSSDKQTSTFPYRFQLEQDVQRLRQQLQEEMELHIVLERAVEHTALTTSRLSCLPHNAKELLSSISMLETTVSKLEEEMVSLHYRLSQERNERRLVQYHLKHSPSNSLLGFSKNAEEQLIVTLHENPVVFDKVIEDETTSLQEIEEVVVEKFTREMPVKGLWNHPNQLSEEMVRCMRNIFISLAESSSVQSKPSPLDTQSSYLSPLGHFSNSSLWSLSDQSTVSSCSRSAQSDARRPSQELAKEYACDPYRVRGKLSWANLGRYKSAVEVSWMSVGKAQLEYASEALRKFRSLVEQLAKVNPNHLSSNEKLAFWINLYNALIMHAYLAYGVPKSDLKLFSLMQKAAYTVGGHSFSAAAIEYVILKMKPPVHRPQTSLLLAIHKLKVPEEQGTLSIDTVEPLVAFALSCGMFSSPVVRIYTAKNVRAELQEAQRDFVRAAIGVSSKGKLLVPKMLHCFARGVIDDSSLAVWISSYLPPDQAAFVEQCMSHRRQRFLGSRNCAVLPYDSSFRYLFLPDEVLS